MTDYSSLLSTISGITHGFGNQSALLPTQLKPYAPSQPEKKQVHGTRIVDIHHPAQACGEADGFFTREPGILISILTADCLPVLFSRQDGSAVGVAHAGWRGLLAGILEQMAERISLEDHPSNWVAAIGPAAGACCYQVDEELISLFQQKLPFPPEMISPSYRHLDLKAIAEAKLNALGFAAIDHAGSCTICTPNRLPEVASPFKYTSYRRASLRRKDDPSYPGIAGQHQHSGIIIRR